MNEMKQPFSSAGHSFPGKMRFQDFAGRSIYSVFFLKTVALSVFLCLISLIAAPDDCHAEAASTAVVGFLTPKTVDGLDEKSIITGFELFFREKSLNPSAYMLQQKYGPTEESLLESFADLLKRPDVKFVVAPMDIKSAERIVEASAASNVIIFVPHGSVRFVSGELCSPNIFRLRPNTYVSSQPLAKWAFLNLGPKVFIVNDEGLEANEQADFFALGMERIGGSFGDRIKISRGSEDYDAVFDKIKDVRPDFVFAALSRKNSPGFLKAFRDNSAVANIPLIGVESLTSYPEPIKSLGKEGLGIRTLTSMLNPVEFEKSLAGKSGRSLNLEMVAQGYDIASVLYSCIQKGLFAEGASEKPAEYISKLTIDGPRGKIQFDANREAIVPMAVGHWVTDPNGGIKRVVDADLDQCRSIDFGCGGVGFPDRPEQAPVDSNQGLWEEHQQ